MAFISIIVAAAGAYAFGAVWYMVNAKRWIAAAEIELDENGKPAGGSAAPYVISALMAILVAGMMRHVFGMAGIDTVGEGFMAGAGLGLFIASPWIVTNYAYSMRPNALTLIDCGYATIGCTIIGVILTLF